MTFVLFGMLYDFALCFRFYAFCLFVLGILLQDLFFSLMFPSFCFFSFMLQTLFFIFMLCVLCFNQEVLLQFLWMFYILCIYFDDFELWILCICRQFLPVHCILSCAKLSFNQVNVQMLIYSNVQHFLFSNVPMFK